MHRAIKFIMDVRPYVKLACAREDAREGIVQNYKYSA